jgi:dTDP-glucose pyrophosphorylase
MKKCWGIIPAAGAGTRIQPLPFSKELLPVGYNRKGENVYPKTICEYLIGRMSIGGVTTLCVIISHEKNDIVKLLKNKYDNINICYVVQDKPLGLCDALFRASGILTPQDLVMIGLPDTIWYPEDAFVGCEDDNFTLILFPVDNPEQFDSVIIDENDTVQQVLVKNKECKERWIWGAMKMPGHVFFALYELWIRDLQKDEYLGTLINKYIKEGGCVKGKKIGTYYGDVGTVNGYSNVLEKIVFRSDLIANAEPD